MACLGQARSSFESPIGKDLHYTITADPVPLAAAYEQWYIALQEGVFGDYPDARLEALIHTENRRDCPILDVGAGLGRNAVYLAERGFSVDAVKPTPVFVEAMTHAVRRNKLSVRIIARNWFECHEELRRDYWLVLASGFAGDLRNFSELDRLFETAVDVLAPGGHLLVNLHVVRDGYTPTHAALEWAQQCCATLFTAAELGQLTSKYPPELIDDSPALEYEQAHSSADTWPPTPAFTEWASGVHLAELDRQHSPFELRWLLYRKDRRQD